jgi:hypothetical protein
LHAHCDPEQVWRQALADAWHVSLQLPKHSPSADAPLSTSITPHV